MLQLLETNPQTILKEMLGLLEGNYKTKIYEGDQRYIFISSLAYIVAVERVKANLAFNQNFLSEAYGIALDQKGIDLNTPRLGVSYAEVICKFTLSKEQEMDYKIPQGTRVSTITNQTFATVSDLIILRGGLEGVIKCQSINAGSIYNDIDIGFINKFVDVLPYVQSVTNINKSSGGADSEEDDAYRERLKIAEAQYSTAGSILSYRYLTLKSDANISDVLITTPEPGVVEIRPVLRSGELPTEIIINRIRDTFSKEKNYPNTTKDVLITTPEPGVVEIRPVLRSGELPTEIIINRIRDTFSKEKNYPNTTKLNILIPDVFNYGIELDYYIKNADKVNEKEIQKRVEDAIEDFIYYQKTNINIYLNPDDLRKRILNAGAYMVNIKSPGFTTENLGKVLVITEKNIKYGGLI